MSTLRLAVRVYGWPFALFALFAVLNLVLAMVPVFAGEASHHGVATAMGLLNAFAVVAVSRRLTSLYVALAHCTEVMRRSDAAEFVGAEPVAAEEWFDVLEGAGRLVGQVERSPEAPARTMNGRPRAADFLHEIREISLLAREQSQAHRSETGSSRQTTHARQECSAPADLRGD